MRTPWTPRLIVEEGDRTYEWKGALDIEIEEVARLAGEPSMGKAEVTFNALAGPPKVLRAVLFILKRRAGEPVTFDALSVDTETTVAYLSDESGREVTFKIAPAPCGLHRDGHVGLVEGCPNCGVESPVLTEDGTTIAWFYEDSGEPVPTRRARGAVPGLSPTSSGSGSASEPGIPTT